jgi:ComF family protein
MGFFGAGVLDMFYPRSCEGCGASLNENDGLYLCLDCLAHASVIRYPFCRICGQPVFGMIDHEYACYHCSEKRPHYDKARSCVMYDGVMRELLIRFKYYSALWLVPDFAVIMRAVLDAEFELEGIDGFAAVPLYHSKKRQRGFNQADVLACELAKSYRKSLYSKFIKRTRRTDTQTKLTAHKRQSNVSKAFGTRRSRWLEGRRLILIDDVMTTGATVNECARVLKQAGAARVEVLTLARGVL